MIPTLAFGLLASRLAWYKMLLNMTTTGNNKLMVNAIFNQISDNLPRFDIFAMYIRLNNAFSPDQQDNMFLNTIGGNSDYSNAADQIRFEPSNSKLIGLLLSESGKLMEKYNIDFLEQYNLCLLRDGTLQLVKKENFKINWSLQHYYYKNGDTIISLLDSFVLSDLSLRIRIAVDLELLVCRDNIAGWALNNASRYIVRGYDSLDSNFNSKCIEKTSNILNKYLHLIWKIDDPESDAVIGVDEWIREELVSLSNLINETDAKCYQLDVLKKIIDEKLSYYF